MANNKDIVSSNIDDLQFGFQLLGDYSRFIRDALSCQAMTETEKAQEFITVFDELYTKSRQLLSSDHMKDLNGQAFQSVQEFRKYILQLLKKQISKTIKINLNPPSLNMMVNTTELLLDGLSAYMRNTFPDTTHLTSTWLQDIYIAILNIHDKIGVLYFEDRAKAEEFAKFFLNLYSKSLILDGLCRTGLEKIPAFNQFYNQIQKHMIRYAEFLVELINLLIKKECIGMLTLLDVDSMYRRACFFMTKLSLISDIQAPVCDPASPRME